MTDDEFEKLKNQIGVLRLQDGDCLVIKSPTVLPMDVAEHLIRRGRALLQDIGVTGDVVVADGGVEFDVIRAAPSIVVNISGPVDAQTQQSIRDGIAEAMQQYDANLSKRLADPRRGR